MGMNDCVNNIIVCREIKDNVFYWESQNGTFGIYTYEYQQPKDVKINDIGLLRYVDNKWSIEKYTGETK